MPSLATRRRRAAAAPSAADDLLEGGGNRGTMHTDTQGDTQHKIKHFQQQNKEQEQIMQRVRLVSFPLFLFGLLSIFSRSLHLSFLSCVIIPLGLGLLLFGGSLLYEFIVGKKTGSTLFAQHGQRFIFLLLVFTLLGLAISQWFFRDKLGAPML